MQEDEEEVLQLSEKERTILKGLLQRYIPKNDSASPALKRIKFYMLQKQIWIPEKKLLKEHPHPNIIRSLVKKKILKPHHIVGYQINIKNDFFQQINDLINNEDWELTVQLAGIWVEL